MVAARPRPGIEVVQQISAVAASIVRPQLAPCNVAPFFEVLEVQTADGLVNADALFTSLYRQQALTIPQVSFPNPRGNIEELNILEDSIRAFFYYGNKITELSRTSSFLVGINLATQPFIDGTLAGPYNLDGLQLVVQFDGHTAIGTGLPNASSLSAGNDKIITFVGNALALAAVIEQVNAVIPDVALESPLSAGRLRIRSTKTGAGASAVVRASGSANVVLGFPAAPTVDTIAVGAGFYALDDADGDITTPRLEIFAGTTQRAVTAANTGGITVPLFTDLNVKAGDFVVADGGLIGEIDQVFTTRLVMHVEQNIFSQATHFAPRYVWVQANNLTFPQDASTAGTLTGSIVAHAASRPFISTESAFSAVGAGQNFNIDVTIDGVAQTTEVISSGAGWASIAAAVTSINTQSVNFEVYASNIFGDEVDTAIATRIGFRTLADNSGSAAGISYSAQTAGMSIGMTQTLPVSDVGENIRYRVGTVAQARQAGAWTAGVGVTAAQTTTYTPTVNGAAQAAETIVWPSNRANNAAGLLLAIADWNALALFTEAYSSDASGNEVVNTNAAARFAIRSRGENIGADAIINVTGGTNTVVVGGVASHAGSDTDLNGAEFKWLLDGNPQVYTAVFVSDEDDGGVSQQAVVNAINALTPSVASVSADSPPALVLTSTIVGEASSVKIGAGTNANSYLGFTLDQANTGNGRPNPDMAISPTGDLVVQAQQLRDVRTGTPFAATAAQLYTAYRALRLDVSPRATNPGLLIINDTAQLLDIASPISTANPGALMTFLTLSNSPGVSATAIGVPEISADAPDGTPIGYTECFEFLESEDVYAMALGTQNPLVHQTGIAHVDHMSDPRQKGERIIFINQPEPTRDLATVLGSGTDANTSATPGEVRVEGNLAAALVAAGIDPLDVNPSSGVIENEVYLNLGSDSKFYLVQSIANGDTLTLRTTFADSEDVEQFFSRSNPSGIISDDWSVELRGEKLLKPGTTDIDRDRVADTVARTALAYNNRRVFFTFPDRCVVAPSGINQNVPGYYSTSSLIGMVSGLPPQQPFTNLNVGGLVQVPGSSGTYSQGQLEIIGGGGAFILVQDVRPGGPVTIWHQLSTDTSSIARQELSVTKTVDYTAKFVRRGLRAFIGRRNITPTFIDELHVIAEGLFKFLTDVAGVLIGASIERLVQDPTQVDQIIVEVILNVPFPCNYIRVILIV